MPLLSFLKARQMVEAEISIRKDLDPKALAELDPVPFTWYTALAVDA